MSTFPPEFHAEIQYHRPGVGYVHSDICWHPDAEKDPAAGWIRYRSFAHKLLDEFLDNYQGDGMFYLSNDILSFFRD